MRTEKLTFDVPVDILASLKIGTRVLETDMRRSLAVRYYKNKRLSLGKSAKLAEMNRLDFMDYLAAEGNVVFDYDESDLQEELNGMETLKAEAISAISKLPESASIDDIMYELYVIDKVKKGRDATERGDTITIEELKREMQSW